VDVNVTSDSKGEGCFLLICVQGILYGLRGCNLYEAASGAHLI